MLEYATAIPPAAKLDEGHSWRAVITAVPLLHSWLFDGPCWPGDNFVQLVDDGFACTKLTKGFNC